jgi:hypothetical protein
LQDLEDHTGDIWLIGHVPLPHGELKDRQAGGGLQQSGDANRFCAKCAGEAASEATW